MSTRSTIRGGAIFRLFLFLRSLLSGRLVRRKDDRDGCLLHRGGDTVFCGRCRVRARMQQAIGGRLMIDEIIAGLTSLLLLLYLIYALLRPERF